MDEYNDELITKISSFYKTLADPSRLKIILTLLENEDLCVNCIVDKVGMSQTAVSNQLKMLKIVGLVSSERRGKNIIYRINDNHVENIIKLTLIHMEENDEY